MGRLKNGLFGEVTGRIGNLVAYNLNGKNVVRQIGVITTPPSPKQKANYQKMAVTNIFLKPINEYLKVGFEFVVRGTDKQPYNEAVSYNKKYALKGEYPTIEMDYPKALVTMGILEPAINPSLTVLPNGIKFKWEVSPGMDWHIKLDRAMILLFFPSLQKAQYLFTGAQRRAGEQFIEIWPEHIGLAFEAYISFYADDKESVSNSVWVPQ